MAPDLRGHYVDAAELDDEFKSPDNVSFIAGASSVTPTAFDYRDRPKMALVDGFIFAKANADRIAFRNIRFFRCHFELNEIDRLCCIDCDFESCRFEGASRGKFDGCQFIECQFHAFKLNPGFGDKTLKRFAFCERSSDRDGIEIDARTIAGVGINSCSFFHAIFNRTIEESVLSSTVFKSCTFPHGVANACTLHNVRLRNCNLERSASTLLDKCEIDTCHFDIAGEKASLVLSRCNVVSPEPSWWTPLLHADTITPVGMRSLDLSDPQTATIACRLRVADPFIGLQELFVGYRRFIFYAAVVGFLFPYIVFVGEKLAERLIYSDDAYSATMLGELVRFSWTGQTNGEMTSLPAISFVSSLLFLVFNVFRLALYWRYEEAMAEAEIRGTEATLPPHEADRISKLLRCYKVIAGIGYFALVIHLGKFFLMRVPAG